MEAVTLIIIVVAVIVVIALMRGVKPESKTDAQLNFLYQRSLKSGKYGAADREKIEIEMKKRGLLGGNDNPARTLSTEPHMIQLNASQLRESARKAYDEGWKMGEGKWSEKDRKRHQHALTNVLLRRMQKEPGAPAISESLLNGLGFEAIPFIALTPDAGKVAICEYIVWREHPDLANTGIIQNAIDDLKSQGFVDDVLKGSDKEKLESISWSKLL